MMHSKSHNASGQTFIEIMLTVFMIGSLLSAVLVMQSTLFSRVTNAVARMNRMFLLQQVLFEADLDAQLKKKVTEKKNIEKPPTTITYKEKPLDEKSAVRGFKNCVGVTVEAAWDQLSGSQKESLRAFRYRLQKEKK